MAGRDAVRQRNNLQYHTYEILSGCDFTDVVEIAYRDATERRKQRIRKCYELDFETGSAAHQGDWKLIFLKNLSTVERPDK